MSFVVRFSKPSADSSESAKEFFTIAVELNRLGLSGVVDLDQLAESDGEEYAQKLISSREKNRFKIQFLVQYLSDIRSRLKQVVMQPKPSGKRSAEAVEEEAEEEPSKQARSEMTGSSTPDLADVTPRKETTKRGRRSVGTPMTAPHKSASVESPDLEVIRMRDKYYTQIQLFREFIKTPYRSSKSEAESDNTEVKKEIDKFKTEIEDPSLSDSRREIILDKVKKFVEQLGLTSPVISSSASTPQPQKRPTRDVRELDDGQFLFVFKLHGETLATPARETREEAVNDKAKCEAELARVHKLSSVAKVVVSRMKQFVEELDKETNIPIFRFRGKLHSTVNVNGGARSTPLRQTESEIRRDVKAAQQVLQSNPNCDDDILYNLVNDRWTQMAISG